MQTPVLGLVVRRDMAIEEFVSKPFYEVLAHLQTQGKEPFTAKWKPSEACQKWQDEEGRVLSKPLAENVVGRITGQPGTVVSIEKKPKKNPPPLPYNLSALQIDANKRFSMSAQQVLDTCQALYEKHKLITYPRSDCRYLPEAHFMEADAVLSAVMAHCSSFSSAQNQINPQKRSKAWNDKKVEAHHAIIPTLKKTNFSALSKAEQQVYELIARQYLIQFMDDHRYNETNLVVDIAGGIFTARAKQITQPGWKLLFPSNSKNTDNETENLLPDLKQGDQLFCEKGELLEKMTQPPKHFTDATLLAAMTGISRYVEDPAIKKVLKETDGLGTEATRAGIIELLFKRKFLARKGKAIHSTETGRALIHSLPDCSSKPDMTAQWEQSLNKISLKETSYQLFMGELSQTLQQLVGYAVTMNTDMLKQLPNQPFKKSKRRQYKTRKKSHA